VSDRAQIVLMGVAGFGIAIVFLILGSVIG